MVHVARRIFSSAGDLADELVELLLGQDRCYGMAISRRECEDWALVDLDDLAVAVEEELL